MEFERYFIIALFIFASCGGKPIPNEVSESGQLNLPKSPFNYSEIKFPEHFYVETERFHGQRPLINDDNTPRENPTTNDGATLGRVLFYDQNLSKNRTISCASCHKAKEGFSDKRRFSLGFENRPTRRHSMGLTNARFYQQGRFFWDQRAGTLEQQVLMPFQDPVEMGMTLATLVERVEQQNYYRPLFAAAFGTETVTSERISFALSQFVRSIVSYQSKYDVGRELVARRSMDFPNFTAEENYGKRLFVSPPPRGGFGCFACHQGEGFIARHATSNGLDAAITDRGYGEITNNAWEQGTFKAPSLRNVALRAPYMHDGRFSSLEEVVEHYSQGIQSSPNLEPPLFPGRKFMMNQQQKNALIAFLHTLTDPKMIADEKFSDPFVRK